MTRSTPPSLEDSSYSLRISSSWSHGLVETTLSCHHPHLPLTLLNVPQALEQTRLELTSANPSTTETELREQLEAAQRLYLGMNRPRQLGRTLVSILLQRADMYRLREAIWLILSDPRFSSIMSTARRDELLGIAPETEEEKRSLDATVRRLSQALSDKELFACQAASIIILQEWASSSSSGKSDAMREKAATDRAAAVDALVSFSRQLPSIQSALRQSVSFLLPMYWPVFGSPSNTNDAVTMIDVCIETRIGTEQPFVFQLTASLATLTRFVHLVQAEEEEEEEAKENGKRVRSIQLLRRMYSLVDFPLPQSSFSFRLARSMSSTAEDSPPTTPLIFISGAGLDDLMSLVLPLRTYLASPFLIDYTTAWFPSLAEESDLYLARASHQLRSFQGQLLSTRPSTVHVMLLRDADSDDGNDENREEKKVVHVERKVRFKVVELSQPHVLDLATAIDALLSFDPFARHVPSSLSRRLGPTPLVLHASPSSFLVTELRPYLIVWALILSLAFAYYLNTKKSGSAVAVP